MEFLGLLFAFAAVAWGGYLAHRVSLQLLALAVLIIGTVFGPSFFAFQGPISFSIDRILWFAMLGLFLVKCLSGKTRPLALNRMDWMILAFVFWLLVSSQLGKGPDDGTSPLARWIFYAFLPLGIYCVARFSRLSRFELQIMQGSLIGLGVYLGLTAIAEKLGLTSFIFPGFIVDPGYVEFLGRGRGPLLNPTGNGFLLAIAIGVVTLTFQKRSRLGRAGCVLAASIAAGGVYATLTRSVWVAAVASISLIQLNRVSRSLRIWALVASVLVTAALAFGLGDQILHLKRDKHLSASAAAESIELRPMLAVIAFEMFKDRPVIGFGYGHYFAYNQHYIHEGNWQMPLRKAAGYMQHNVMLSYLVDTGLLGMGLLSTLLIAWGFKGWQIARSTSACQEARHVGLLMAATVSSYLLNGMFQDVSIIPMVNMYLFYFAGLTVAVDSVDGQLPERVFIDRRSVGIRSSSAVAAPGRFP